MKVRRLTNKLTVIWSVAVGWLSRGLQLIKLPCSAKAVVAVDVTNLLGPVLPLAIVICSFKNLLDFVASIVHGKSPFGCT